jgi:hypothetical protein
MFVTTTAKVLLFIALNVGPHNPPMVYATSSGESYVWTSTATGWTVERKAFPSSDFERNPAKDMSFSGNLTQGSVPRYLRAISRYRWQEGAAMVFDNGDRIEKRGDHAFYIINAGGSNEKVFTILYPKS